MYSFWVTPNDPFFYAPVMDGPEGVKVVSDNPVQIDVLVPSRTLVTNEGQTFFTYHAMGDEGLIVYDYNTAPNDGSGQNIHRYTKNGDPLDIYLVTGLDRLRFSDGFLTAQVTAILIQTFPDSRTFIAQWDFREGFGSRPDPIVIGFVPEPGTWALSMAGLAVAVAAGRRRRQARQ